MIIGQMGGATSTNITSSNVIGFADGTVSSGSAANCLTNGAISTSQSGLTSGNKYYVQNDGTLSTSAASPSVYAGQAVSSTKLIIKGGL
jgi:hypothetical protein